MLYKPFAVCLLLLAVITSPAFAAKPKPSNVESATDQHGDIGVKEDKTSTSHTNHPDAQWYPDAGFGLFLHWGISSVKGMNISWPMIPGRTLGKTRVSDPAELQRIIREKDFDLNHKPWPITPNQYWTMAKDFNPRKYDPDKWLKAAAEAGFTYATLTTRHHEGFAMWPSAFGDFNTKTYANGQDLVKPFVDACRKNGLKVGLYYSPPDWYFDREYKNFFHHSTPKKNPELPALDADLNPRTARKSPEEIAKHRAAYAAYVGGQIEELLTRYGKIDLLWFDGCPDGCKGDDCITLDRIRQLQPGIVINPRLHGRGDFITYERELKTSKVATGWAEFCNTWTNIWTWDNKPFRSNAFALGQLATCRSLGINYLLGIGPDGQGELHDNAYSNMAIVADWMKLNRAAIQGAKPLPKGESASVPATASGSTRYLFAIPQFKEGGMYDQDMLPPADLKLTLKTSAQPKTVKLLADGSELKFDSSNKTLSIDLPASKRTKLVDVVQVDLEITK